VPSSAPCILRPSPLHCSLPSLLEAATRLRHHRASVAALLQRRTIGRPEEIGSAALFLASEDSSFVNGVELFVDGGTAQI
jgi:NAD(P)-dependent dehydrogenase (short-subunit alcohol dehydrogenase family)